MKRRGLIPFITFSKLAEPVPGAKFIFIHSLITSSSRKKVLHSPASICIDSLVLVHAFMMALRSSSTSVSPSSLLHTGAQS